jgi:hypothetical protein
MSKRERLRLMDEEDHPIVDEIHKEGLVNIVRESII